MDPLLITLTRAGLSVLVGDDTPSLGPVVITQLGLTDAAFTVASTLEALPGEFKRIDISGQQVGDDTLHMTALDASDDVYSYRGFALYLADGTLFAVYGQPGPIAAKAAPSASFFVLDIKLAEGQADNITFGDTNFLNPPATTTRQGVVELATHAEAAAGTDTQRALTPAAMQAAILAMLLRVHGAGSALDADLLDGHEGAWYADIVSRLGYVPFDSAGFTGAAVRSVLGYNPQDAAASTSGSNANGWWEKRPNGVLEQWGQATAGDPWSGALTFPTPFADTASISITATSRQSDNVATDGNKINAEWIDAATFKLGSDDNPKPVFWRAIGKAPA